jgi:Na+/proline symporter
MLLKIVDVGAKWAAIATLLSVFTGVSLNQGILITGAITAVYCTIGGLWADALTELGQFAIQLLAGLSMFVAVVLRLNDKGIGFLGAWDEPALHGHAKPLVGPYGTVFLLAFLFIKLFEYNGGMLNQAQRYMATGSARQAERSAWLSSVLWLVWPV